MAKTDLSLEETKVAYEELKAAVQVFRDAVYKFTGVYKATFTDLTDVSDDIADLMVGLVCDIGEHFNDENWHE